MPNFETSVSLIHSVEDLSRLASSFQQLGLAAMTARDRKKFLDVMSRGLRLHAASEPNSLGWSEAIADLAKGDFGEVIGQESDESTFNTLSQTILEQPASFVTGLQQDDCLAYASKIALSICLKLIHVDPKKTCHGIKQLFKSSGEDWGKVRGQFRIDHQVTDDQDNLKQVVQDFIRQKDLFTAVSIPPIAAFLTSANTKSLPIEGALSDEQPLEAPSAKRQKAPKPPDNISPDYRLFEAQIFRALHPDVSDGHRLPNNWNRQSSEELRPTIQKLCNQLRQSGVAHRATRIHAAARFVSLFCGLSLKTCLTLPIGWGHRKCRGTMHVDLKYGVLRRDALCAAPRKNRPGKLRTNGRWWRVHLPPEVVSVLVEIIEAAPDAQTLGELVHAAGLNHESCQYLLNDGFPTSHRPEDARLAFSFRTCLLDLCVHPDKVARASGDTSTTPFSDHFYLTFTEHQIHSAIVTFCDWAGLVAPAQPPKDRRIGSPKAINLEDFQKVVHHLLISQ